MDVLIGVFGRGIWRSKSTVYGRMCPRRRFGMCARVRVLCWIYGLLTQPVNDVWIVVCEALEFPVDRFRMVFMVGICAW
jgi:hypothetical protein